MKQKVTKTVNVDNLDLHPYHEQVYKTSSSEYLESSLIRTGNQPIYPIVVVPIPDKPNRYWIVAGKNRLIAQLTQGADEVEVILYEDDTMTEETIKNLIIDLNKQRSKTGLEKLMEFRHYLDLYPAKKGVKGNRYEKIGMELEMSKDSVKDLTILNNFFDGDGQIILESVFSCDGLSVNQANTLMKCINEYPEKFSNSETYAKLCIKSFDFTRLHYVLMYLNIGDDNEFELGRRYLIRELSLIEFNKLLKQLGRIKTIVQNHEDNKDCAVNLSSKYSTENTHIINGDNRTVELQNKFNKKINCIIGSPPYGLKREVNDSVKNELSSDMTGDEYAEYLVETYRQYIPYLDETGSVYVIIDDYRLKSGDLSCSLEYFVVGMKKVGFHLVDRYLWVKNNPIPNSFERKGMVNSFEMVYRFAIDTDKYYTNPNLYIENDNMNINELKVLKGCTNPTNKKGNTSKGSTYVQSHLNKVRNTLTEDVCNGIIRGNVANPETYFLQTDDVKHTSTAPMYLTTVLILEGTKEGDLVCDIWNGQGNTMDSALILKRQYIGIELEKDYYEQTCNRANIIEERMSEFSKQEYIPAA